MVFRPGAAAAKKPLAPEESQDAESQEGSQEGSQQASKEGSQEGADPQWIGKLQMEPSTLAPFGGDVMRILF